jgi:cytochrome c oxidase subunit 2
MLPPQGSAYAGEVDTLYMFLVYLSIFFFVLIAGLVFWSVFRYRRRPGRKAAHITDHLQLELTWSIVPLIIVIGIFFWGVEGFMKSRVPPGDAMEITITAKKWVWQFEYPDGTRTINELHVPLNKPVKFLMISEDVIHDFFVPDMRVKHDILPNRYTEIWFQPTVEGLHVATCAEYCGKGHSDMHAKLWVDNEEKYKKWVEEGGDEWKTMSPHDYGMLLYESKGCSVCHSLDGTRHDGPSWKGIYGQPVELSTGKTVMVDENYVRESIMDPQAKVVKGFEPVMPTFQGMLRERETKALIDFIKTVK